MATISLHPDFVDQITEYEFYILSHMLRIMGVGVREKQISWGELATACKWSQKMVKTHISALVQKQIIESVEVPGEPNNYRVISDLINLI